MVSVVVSNASINIVPLPSSVKETNGTYQLRDGATVVYNNKLLKPAAGYLVEKLAPATGYSFEVRKGVRGDICLVLADNKNPEDESYTLSVSANGIVIASASYKGIIHGISSLRQLLPHEIESPSKVAGKVWTVPTVEISDKPAYEWRGMMLDPVRHFYSMEETKRFLDHMALYKFSKFHWHLIDSQAWRIEIKKYPLLTDKGAWRDPAKENIDVACEKMAKEGNDPAMKLPRAYFKTKDGKEVYGGYYSQKEIKEIVAYAAVRGIDVVPELDMPGHNHMATRCYPWLGCAHDGTDPLCVGSDATLKFCKNVYKEVFRLFPFGYAEIGGDEVKRKKWENCPLCQERVRKEGLKDMAELQSWFTREMEKFFNKHGRRLIGWDEILEGGVSPTATVNWWQGYHTDVVQKSTSGGNEVICCPTTFCYFDYGQDSTTIKKLYTSDIVPADLTPQQKRLVKGIQANIWGEYIPTEARMQYMVFPRILALAEKAWTADGSQNWDDFVYRLVGQTMRLDALKINYRPLEAAATPGFLDIYRRLKAEQK